MKREIKDLWARATKTLETARLLLVSDPNSSASRSYYAAFFAVSALFGHEAKFFKKHSALEAAIHRDLVQPGRWTNSLGSDFSFLRELRETGDYGGAEHVSPDEAGEALQAAIRIYEAVRQVAPEIFA